MHKSPVVLYLGAPTQEVNQKALCYGLEEFGLSLKPCINLHNLSCEIDLIKKSNLKTLTVVLDSRNKQSTAAIGLITAAFSSAGILVFLDTANDAEIINYIQVGANTYCDYHASKALVATLVWDLVWRGIPNSSVTSPSVANHITNKKTAITSKSILGKNKSWQLLSNGWYLQSPCQKKVKLTTVERLLCIKLFSKVGNQASHKELLEAISGAPIKSPTRKQIINLSVAISRIKRKCNSIGITIPIESVHSVGYMFVPDCADSINSANT